MIDEVIILKKDNYNIIFGVLNNLYYKLLSN